QPTPPIPRVSNARKTAPPPPRPADPNPPPPQPPTPTTVLPSLTPDQALAEPSNGPLARILEAAFASLTRDHALAALRAAGVPAVPCPNRSQIFTAETALANRALAVVQTARYGPVAHSARFARFGAHDPDPLPAPELGQHSRQSLLRAGLTDQEINALLTAGVTSQPETHPS
ncbi:MAG: Crotonobetainyl-CoA:carnitine CoA-transferase CaiB, partial [Chloroflexi bacterium]